MVTPGASGINPKVGTTRRNPGAGSINSTTYHPKICKIRPNPGRIAKVGLAAAEEYKQEYYAGRLAAGSSRAWVYRELALAAKENGGQLSYDGIDSLTESVRRKTGETVDDFLTNALHAGLLAPARNLPDHYRIPIPSFGDYLRALPVEPPQT